MLPTDVLSTSEVLSVVADLHRRRKRSINSWQNLAIFWLSAGCGLRRMEISGLNLDDVTIDGPTPCVKVRSATTKGRAGKRKTRIAPLWWDDQVLTDIAEWKNRRESEGAGPADPFVCNRQPPGVGKRLSRESISRRFFTAIRILGPNRINQQHVHCGRHTFLSHALSAGRSLVEVRDAAGHTNIAITSIYLHALPNDNARPLYGE